MLGRALLAFALLPGVVAFLVPLWLAWPAVRAGTFHWIALVLLAPGLALLLWCVREFYVTGKGTLAPWDPPRHLVAVGPYRVSRNPMYLGVVLILAGWTIAFASPMLAIYGLIVAGAFHLRVRLNEEPFLSRTHGTQWTQYAGRVPRWLFRSRRALVYSWLAFLVLAPLAGRSYETWAERRDRREFTAPGRRVDIGGRHLHLICIGAGTPVIVFEAAGWQTALSSTRARERLAATTTVCSYDRRGMGFSDPSTGTASAGDLARDLLQLLDRTPIATPIVIVASSIGGLTAEMFARQHPERVNGLVFLDAASSLGMVQHAGRVPWVKAAACTASVLAEFGVIRVLDPFHFGRERTPEARRAAALTYTPRPWTLMCDMARAYPLTVEEFAAAPPLRGDLPMIVLSAASRDDLLPPALRPFLDVSRFNPDATASHQQLARVSARGRWMEVPNSGHLIASSQPDAVVSAVLQVLEAVR